MTIQMIYELNHTYMAVFGDEIEKKEDYRYRMLASNEIKEILPLEIRKINNEREIYIDVTGKETLLNYFNSRMADRREVRKLFDAMFIAYDRIGKYLIGESDICIRPEMIFRDTKTGEYEFICIPLEEEGMNEEMQTLLQYLMMHLDNSDEKLVAAVYSMNDMYTTSSPTFTVAHDLFYESIREEEPVEDEPEVEEEEEIGDEGKLFYVPSLKEIGVAILCAVGVALIGYNLYLSMILV